MCALIPETIVDLDCEQPGEQPCPQTGEKRYVYKYFHPAVATDCVVFGCDGTSLKVLLVERGGEPFKGDWALPGGFLREDETAEECARRELAEETSLTDIWLEQLHTFSAVGRDPRERVISIAFVALVRPREVRGGDDAANARWFSIHDIPSLAFDHEEIFQMALRRLRERIHFRPVGFDLLNEEFTMSQVQRLYETILGVRFDRRNFYRKMLGLKLIMPVRERDKTLPRATRCITPSTATATRS